MKQSYNFTQLFFFSVIGLVSILGLYRSGAFDYFSLQYVQSQAGKFREIVEQEYLLAALFFIVFFATAVLFALPVFFPFCMLGGYLFGNVVGTLFNVVSVLIGSLVTFFVMRFILRSFVQNRYKKWLDRFIEQTSQYGYSYMLVLHFSGIIPLFPINVIAALSDISTVVFLCMTVVGSFPMLLIATLAGQQMTTINSLSDVVKPHMVILLIFLALFAALPMILRRLGLDNSTKSEG